MDGRRISLCVLAAGFAAAGTLHFLFPGAYARIVPPWLPAPRALVYASGFFELAGGIGLLHPRTRRVAAAGLVLLLLAVWPANLEMALDARAAGAPPAHQALLWLRLPLQPLLMGWVAWAARARRSAGS